MEEQADSRPMNELAHRWTDEQMDAWISGQVNGWMARHFYTWLSVCIPVMSNADFSPSCMCVHVCTLTATFVLMCAFVHMCVMQLPSAGRLSLKGAIQRERWHLLRWWDIISVWTFYYFRLLDAYFCMVLKICRTWLAFSPDRLYMFA